MLSNQVDVHRLINKSLGKEQKRGVKSLPNLSVAQAEQSNKSVNV